MENEKELCPTCGHIVSERRIGLYKGMATSLWRVYQWCLEKRVHEFSRRDIRHLLANENDTARFGDWVMFGGLVYKHGKGHYGLNMERCKKFFVGEYEIPLVIWKNPVTGELRKENYRMVNGIPSLMSMLNEKGEYVAQYRQAKMSV